MRGMLIGLNVDLRQTDGMLGYGKEGVRAACPLSYVILVDRLRPEIQNNPSNLGGITEVTFSIMA